MPGPKLRVAENTRTGTRIVSTPIPFEKLPKRKRKFVEEFAKTGDSIKAYLAAGYANNVNNLRRARTLHKELTPYIQNAISERMSSDSMAVMGFNVICDLAENGDSEHIRLAAAKEILTRTGYDAPKEMTVHHNHTHNLSHQEVERRIEQIKRELAGKDITPQVEQIEHQ